MKKTIVILMSLALMATIAGTAMARGGGPGGGMGYAKGPGWGAQLTPEQLAQMNKAKAKFMQDTLELRQKAMAKRTELQTLYAADQPDQAKIQATQNELIDLRAQIAKKANEAGLPAGPGMGRGFRGGPGAGNGFCPGYGAGQGGGFGGGPGGGYCWR